MGDSVHRATDMLRESLYAVNSDEGTLDRALDAITVLAQPAALVALLRSVRSNSYAVDSCAALSYHHPLGFDKLALIDAGPDFILRLHTWWPNRLSMVEHVHNHRFGLATVIVRGGYDMRIYRQSGDGVPMIEYHEKLSRGTADWKIRRRSGANLRLISSMRLGQGGCYALPASTFHRISVASETLCITLFLETQTVRSKTRIFAEVSDEPRSFTRKQVLDNGGYIERLEAVLRMLEGSPDSGNA